MVGLRHFLLLWLNCVQIRWQFKCELSCQMSQTISDVIQFNQTWCSESSAIIWYIRSLVSTVGWKCWCVVNAQYPYSHSIACECPACVMSLIPTANKAVIQRGKKTCNGNSINWTMAMESSMSIFLIFIARLRWLVASLPDNSWQSHHLTISMMWFSPSPQEIK